MYHKYSIYHTKKRKLIEAKKEELRARLNILTISASVHAGKAPDARPKPGKRKNGVSGQEQHLKAGRTEEDPVKQEPKS